MWHTQTLVIEFLVDQFLFRCLDDTDSVTAIQISVIMRKTFSLIEEQCWVEKSVKYLNANGNEFI